MRMALGEFRFFVPTLTIDTMDEEVTSRVARQDVIGAAPTTHLLGPGTDTYEWESTYFPLHMNKQAGGLVAALQLAVRAQRPMPMMGVQGLVGIPMGRWIVTKISRNLSEAAANGPFQVVKTSISLERYNTQSSGGFLGLF